MSHRRKKKDPKKTSVKEISGDEEYEAFRKILFQAADRIKEVIREQGFNPGKIKDCAPLYQFRCNKCRSKKIVVYSFTNVVVLACVKCNTMEIVGNPTPMGSNR